MTGERLPSIYDHPKWYDLVYGSDWKAEFDFLTESFQTFASGKVQSVFEPACGTGRLLFRLGKSGFKVAGNDLNPAAIQYCNQRLEKHGLPASTTVGDMCDFKLSAPVDAAFNLVSSFRHIIGLQRAEEHLQCMSRALRPGGIYLLGFHLSPTQVEPTESERWSATRGHLTVNTSMQLADRDWNRRLEKYQLQFDVYTPTDQKTVKDLINFQMYTKQDFEKLLERVPEFDILATFDFHFDLEQPVPFDEEAEDLVFVLQKR